MIPIIQFDEPLDFDNNVRQRGLAFLRISPNPTTKEWEAHAYWQEVLPELRSLYDGICNYCATKIMHSTGRHSVDHFFDKKNNPDQAYEWANYRYVSARFNSRKKQKPILDPFNIAIGTFVLNMTNFFVEVNPNIFDPRVRTLAEDTIKVLKFNLDDDLVNERAEFFFEYKKREITFAFLQKQAPFLAYEINRQGL
ncbi:MAG: hypothetical protein IT260_01555 [Saprospiraceae bacterium]|nr:hypothetical protein [Saprospiraceae bacterium]